MNKKEENKEVSGRFKCKEHRQENKKMKEVIKTEASKNSQIICDNKKTDKKK